MNPLDPIMVTPEWLEQLRLLLLIGLFAAMGALLFDLVSGLESKAKTARVARRGRRQSYELCKLHQRPVDECRDMHDQEKTDE